MRNNKFHRKYFALIKTGFMAQDHYTDIAVFRRSVLCGIGFVCAVETSDGIRYYDARSLAYENCSEEDLQKVYKKTIGYFVEKLAINQEILSKVLSYE